MDRSKRAIKTPKRFDDEAFETPPKQHQAPKQSGSTDIAKVPHETPIQTKSIIKVKLNKVRPSISLPKLPKPKQESPANEPKEPAIKVEDVSMALKLSEPSKLKDVTRLKDSPKPKDTTKHREPGRPPKDPTKLKDAPKREPRVREPKLTPKPKETLKFKETYKPKETRTKDLAKPKDLLFSEREPLTIVQRPRTKRPRTPPVYEDLIPNVVLPFWDARTAAEDHEDDNVKELVHCQCGITEELGLMVQCETCLTWQHGHCLGLETADEVRDGYTCKACSDPRFARESRRWAYDQEWLTKGRMKKFPCDPNPIPEKNIEILKRINQLIAESLRIHNLIHSLGVKSKILETASDEDQELRLFRARWGTNDVIDSSSNEAGPDDCRANLKIHIEQMEQKIKSQVESLEKQVITLEEQLKDCKPQSSLESLKNDLETMRQYISLTS